MQWSKPLRCRLHRPVPLDDRYVSYLRLAGLLPLARVLAAGLPATDGPALTALVYWWRPETHTFHLPCGELTMTLQDVAYILGLTIDGKAVCGMQQPAGWRDLVEAVLGLRPPEPAPDEKDNKPSGVSSNWLVNNFSVCSPDVEVWVVQRYMSCFFFVFMIFPLRHFFSISYLNWSCFVLAQVRTCLVMAHDGRLSLPRWKRGYDELDNVPNPCRAMARDWHIQLGIGDTCIPIQTALYGVLEDL